MELQDQEVTVDQDSLKVPLIIEPGRDQVERRAL